MAGVKPPRARAARATAAAPAAAPLAAPATPDAAPPPAPRAGIEVTGPRAGRRRAGLVFGATPVTLSVGDLAEGALEAIRADPLLTVADVEIEAV